MQNKQKIGFAGQEIAKRFLQKNGHLILVENYWYKTKEIDIISFFGGILYLNEVRTRAQKTEDVRQLFPRKKLLNLQYLSRSVFPLSQVKLVYVRLGASYKDTYIKDYQVEEIFY